MTNFTYSKITEAEAELTWSIVEQALHRNADPNWNRKVGYENFRAIRSDGNILGGIAIIDMGQWFGGRKVRTGAVTSVGVAPEGRGIGAASTMLSNALKEMKDNGMAISTLFPSSVRVYRSKGYERSGVKLTYEAPIKEMRAALNKLKVEQASNDEEMVLLFNERAQQGNGNLDRGSLLWDLITTSDGRPFYKYYIRDENQVVGYINYQQSRSGDHIRIRDMVSSTQQSSERILRFFADHRTVIETISWNGPPSDPLDFAMEEQETNLKSSTDWMVRVLNISDALEQRGYPAGVNASVDFEFNDNEILENNGIWHLNINEGRGSVKKVTSPSSKQVLKLGPRGFAPLYTSHYSATDLKIMGIIDGSAETIALANTIFAGPKPWIGEQF